MRFPFRSDGISDRPTPSSTLTILNIYHLQTSSKYYQPISVFLDEFQTFLSSVATTSHEFIITGNFSLHLGDPLDSSFQQFTDILSSTNLIQHVSVSIHIHNHTLDLVITSSHTNLFNNITNFYYCIWSLSYFHSPQPYTHTSFTPCKITFRCTKNINIIEFNNDLTSSDLILHPSKSLPEFLDSYDSTSRSILDKRAPLITKL